jgi:hypothetical protein
VAVQGWQREEYSALDGAGFQRHLMTFAITWRDGDVNSRGSAE